MWYLFFFLIFSAIIVFQIIFNWSWTFSRISSFIVENHMKIFLVFFRSTRTETHTLFYFVTQLVRVVNNHCDRWQVVEIFVKTSMIPTSYHALLIPHCQVSIYATYLQVCRVRPPVIFFMSASDSWCKKINIKTFVCKIFRVEFQSNRKIFIRAETYVSIFINKCVFAIFWRNRETFFL